jgi:beta-lactamase regulating signal transducer with metallopeptidase domain
MIAPGIQELAQVVAERVMNSIAGGLLIAGFAWLVLRMVGKQNSGTRFAVLFSALIAIAVLPLVPGLSSGGAATHAMRAAIMLPRFWAVAICSAWVFFAALAATPVLVGLWNVCRLRKSGVALAPSNLHPTLQETLAHCEGVRPVTVCSSATVSVPTAIGFFKPVILIPEWALQVLPVDELKIILLHEFAHLRRWDDWTNLAQKVVRTVFFFHPAVWWIEKRLSLEREMACDDTVLAETGNPRAYAECLVSLAEKSLMRRSLLQRGLALAQAAISRARETSIRLAQILDVDRPRATRVFKPALGLMAALASVCLIMLPDAPRLIAFENAAAPRNFAAASDTLQRRAQSLVVPVTARTSIEAKQTGVRKVLATPAVYRPPKSVDGKFDQGGFSGPVAIKQQQRQRPVLAVPVAARQSAPAPQVLVVMQTTEFYERGAVVFSVSVWRVTFAAPQRNAVHEGVAAKSI